MIEIARKMRSPLAVMLVSVSVSLTVYLVASLITGQPVVAFGLVLSTIIPAVISYPVSSIIINYYRQIEKQKTELERLNILNNKLFSTLAHDIRSPIATASGLLTLMATEDLAPEVRKKNVEQLQDYFKNLREFLDETLVWSKRQIDGKEPQYSAFNATEVVNSLLKLYEPMLEQKQIQLKKMLPPTTIVSDAGGYSLVIRNLIQNAIKFTPRGGTITIATETADDLVTTKVTDTGVGISEENLHRILSSDRWVSSPGTDNEPGTGFGIKNCLSQVQQLSGHLEITSGLGQGTSVSVSLPREPA